MTDGPKKMGRPRRTGEAARNVTVRASEQERALWEESARSAGLDLSEWIRAACDASATNKETDMTINLRSYDDERDDNLIEIGITWQNRPYDVLAQRNEASGKWEPCGGSLDFWCPAGLPMQAGLEAIAMANERWNR